MSHTNSIYQKLGVDAGKTSVREVFGKIVRNDYPGAFVNMIQSPWSKKNIITKHADGSGSKSITHLILALETGDWSMLKYDAMDAFVMNAGDIAAAGFFDLLFTDTLGINGKNVDKDFIMKHLADGFKEVMELYNFYGIKVEFLGGETADLPNQIGSYVLDVDVFAQNDSKRVITGNVKPGDVIFGFSSGGEARWEEKENSGHMSNGSTMTRHALLSAKYSKKYPFLCLHDYPRNIWEYLWGTGTKHFAGRYNIDEYVPELGMTIGEAALSPTRQWPIVIKILINRLKEMDALHVLHGIVMNTGGGQTKIKHLGQGISYTKNPPEPLPFFNLIKYESGESWKNMYQSYNCGVGLEVVGSPEGNYLSMAMERVENLTGIQRFSLGKCYKNKKDTDKNQVLLFTERGDFIY